jgi:hypothetical protein
MLIWVIAGSVPEQQMNGGIDSMNWISISSSSMPGEALGYHGAAQVEVVRYMHDLQVQPLAKYMHFGYLGLIYWICLLAGVPEPVRNRNIREVRSIFQLIGFFGAIIYCC